MEFFLRMTHGDSITTYGGLRYKGKPFQGLFQGNGAVPVGLVGVSSMILQHQMTQGQGAKVTNCISLSLLLLVDLLYVYYVELLEAAHSCEEFSERVSERFQASVNSYVGVL